MTEQQRVIVRARQLLTVLAAMEEPDTFVTQAFPQTLHEQLKVTNDKRTTRRQLIRLIRERDEAILIVLGRLVQTPNGPLTRPLQSTANALTTRQVDIAVV